MPDFRNYRTHRSKVTERERERNRGRESQIETEDTHTHTYTQSDPDTQRDPSYNKPVIQSITSHRQLILDPLITLVDGNQMTG